MARTADGAPGTLSPGPPAYYRRWHTYLSGAAMPPFRTARVRRTTTAIAVALTLAATASQVPATAADPDPGGMGHERTGHGRTGHGEPASVPQVADDARMISQQLWVPTGVDGDGDGSPDRVWIRVVRPAPEDVGGRRLASIIHATPYRTGWNDVANHDVDHELWYPGAPEPARSGGAALGDRAVQAPAAPPGYAQIVVDSLGTGRSTGCPTVGDATETAGPVAVVDWLNGRAPAFDADGKRVRAGWATGKAGMIGTSYDGTLANQAAATGVRGLKAIVPISAISSWYSYYRHDGLVVAPGGFQGEDVDVLAEFVVTRQDRAICDPVIDALEQAQDRRSGDRSRFWRQRDLVPEADRVRAAVLIAHGMNDWNVRPGQAFRWWSALGRAGVERRLYLTQNEHGVPVDKRLLNRWWAHHLYGVDNGVDRERPVQFQARPDGPMSSYAAWPQPGMRSVRFGLEAGRLWGSLAQGRSGSGRDSFVDTPRLTFAAMANTRSWRHGLVYRTPRLRRDTMISGTPRARLRMSFAGRAANVSVALVELGPRARCAG